MIAEALLIAAATAQAAPADPIAASFAGWYTEVEDDAGDGNSPVRGAVTVGCTTTITGDKGRWTVDWATVRTIALEDSFVFLEGPGLKIAVVGDLRDATGLPRLRALHRAMGDAAERCRTR